MRVLDATGVSPVTCYTFIRVRPVDQPGNMSLFGSGSVVMEQPLIDNQ